MNKAMVVIPLALGVAVLVGATLVQGEWSERWSRIPEMGTFADRLQKLPLEVGDWKGTKKPSISDAERAAAGAEGDITVEYKNTKTGELVTVFAVCGRFLDVWKHRPDRCYPAHGFEMEGEQARESVRYGDAKNPEKADLVTATFKKKDDQKVGLQIYWTWSSDGQWFAAEGVDEFRGRFSRTRPIYKVYYQTPHADGSRPSKDNPCVKLVKDLTPAMNAAFFPDLKNSSPTAGTPNSPAPSAAVAQDQ